MPFIESFFNFFFEIIRLSQYKLMRSSNRNILPALVLFFPFFFQTECNATEDIFRSTLDINKVPRANQVHSASNWRYWNLSAVTVHSHVQLPSWAHSFVIWVSVLTSFSLKIVFKKKENTSSFLGPVTPMFWYSGDVCLGLKGRVAPLTCRLHRPRDRCIPLKGVSRSLKR